MIQSLSYIGFGSPHAEAWPEFASSILGAEVAERGADGAVRLRIDDAAARIYIHPAQRNDLACLGWSVLRRRQCMGPQTAGAGAAARDHSAVLCVT